MSTGTPLIGVEARDKQGCAYTRPRRLSQRTIKDETEPFA